MKPTGHFSADVDSTRPAGHINLVSTSSSPTRRADHVRNRAALIVAARDVFAEQGVDATIDEVVRRAGFAKGTFFRHFPTKETLIQALLADRFTALGDVALEINDTQPPGWATLCLIMERVLDQVAGDRSIPELLDRGGPPVFSEEIIRARERLSDQIERAVSGAQVVGEVRPDLAGTDIPPILFTIAHGTARLNATHPGLGRRYLRLFLDGIRAGETSDLGSPALTRDELPPPGRGGCGRPH
jgi:AcrR family transcriptional regulator